MKKLNKLVAILVALAMMMALAVTSAFAAPAKQTDGNAITNGTADDPANIVVEKVLKLAEGVSIPDDTYTFNVSLVTTDVKVEKDGEEVTVAKAAPGTVSENGFNTVLTAPKPARDAEDATKATSITGELFNEGVTFSEAGTYYFAVTEQLPAKANNENPFTVTTGKVSETYTYDTSTYYVIAGVAKSGDTTYVNSIAVVDENGNKKTIQKITKVDGETTTEYYGYDVENNYQKVEDGALTIKKTVVPNEDTAESGDRNFDTTKKFMFHVTLAAPSTSDKKDVEDAVYNGAVKKADGTLVENKQFNANGTTDVELAHGWYVEFSDIEYGVTYAVTEDDYSAIGYTASGEIEEADAVTLKDNDAGTKSATITNTYKYSDDNTNTGITMNNLPFIVLALVAIGGLVAYVVVRRRNADEA